jgi:hypothetical protein
MPTISSSSPERCRIAARLMPGRWARSASANRGADAQHRVEGVHRALQHDRDVVPAHTAQFVPGGGQEVDRAVEPHVAGGDDAGRAQQPGDGIGERGLAAAAFPGQAEHLTAVQGQVRVHCALAEAIFHVQPGHLDKRAGAVRTRRA